jgi:hypothetical protein
MRLCCLPSRVPTVPVSIEPPKADFETEGMALRRTMGAIIRAKNAGQSGTVVPRDYATPYLLWQLSKDGYRCRMFDGTQTQITWAHDR